MRIEKQTRGHKAFGIMMNKFMSMIYLNRELINRHWLINEKVHWMGGIREEQAEIKMIDKFTSRCARLSERDDDVFLYPACVYIYTCIYISVFFGELKTK